MPGRVIRKIIELVRRRSNMVEYCRSIGVKVGNECVIKNDVAFGTEPYLVTLGDHVHLTGGVRFVTHDGGVWVFRAKHSDWDLVSPVLVEDNVYIGIKTIVMPGVTIGKNSVIGAGAIVTRDIPPNSVAVGVPARVIKTVDEYYKGMVGRAIQTKLLTPEQKKQFLIEHFKVKQ